MFLNNLENTPLSRFWRAGIFALKVLCVIVSEVMRSVCKLFSSDDSMRPCPYGLSTQSPVGLSRACASYFTWISVGCRYRRTFSVFVGGVLKVPVATTHALLWILLKALSSSNFWRGHYTKQMHNVRIIAERPFMCLVYFSFTLLFNISSYTYGIWCCLTALEAGILQTFNKYLK